jgi:hypothetical protein
MSNNLSQTPCRNGPDCSFNQTGTCRYSHIHDYLLYGIVQQQQEEQEEQQDIEEMMIEPDHPLQPEIQYPIYNGFTVGNYGSMAITNPYESYISTSNTSINLPPWLVPCNFGEDCKRKKRCKFWHQRTKNLPPFCVPCENMKREEGCQNPDCPYMH